MGRLNVSQIQQSDPVLYEIVHRVLKSDQINKKFVIRDQILFKVTLIYGMQIYRLCLPMNLAREVLTVMHNYKGAHMSTDNLRIKFK